MLSVFFPSAIALFHRILCQHSKQLKFDRLFIFVRINLPVCSLQWPARMNSERVDWRQVKAEESHESIGSMRAATPVSIGATLFLGLYSRCITHYFYTYIKILLRNMCNVSFWGCCEEWLGCFGVAGDSHLLDPQNDEADKSIGRIEKLQRRSRM